MIINNSWAFVHIPRTGGKTLKSQYVAQGGSEQEVKTYLQMVYNKEISEKVLDFDSQGGIIETIFTEHAKLALWEQCLTNQSVFTIVRNPYDRIVSLWRRFKDLYAADYPHLDEFSLFLTFNLGTWSINTTQKEFIKSASNRSITIYKFETDLEAAYTDHGLTFANAVNASVNVDDPLQDLDNLALVNTIFDEDFTEFGYEKR